MCTPVEVGRTAGRRDGRHLKGLDGGETVVVDGALLLIEGAKVEVRDAAEGGELNVASRNSASAGR